MSAASMATPHRQTATISFIPREHGATAMLLIPFFSAAILAREFRWTELAALVAAFTTFAAKDPLIVLARQRWIWRQQHPETEAAKLWLAGEALILAAAGLALATAWPLWILAGAAIGAVAFSALAVYITVRNRQRSTLFQILSAIALSSTSAAACLSATGAIQTWGLWLWLLCSMQAAAGILAVHARLEARIAARKAQTPDSTWRRPALIAGTTLLLACIPAAILRQPWIAAALALGGTGYLYDLRRQLNLQYLQMPLTKVGLRAMSLAIAYAVLLIVGLWQ